ncbi:MAG: alpha/beta fold hydrolase [Deltaproteobacteria bacterium]|nr:alpha/beta fold hydrolase [Deltaproteobacteria bacterium]
MRTDVDPTFAREVLLKEGLSLLTHGLMTPFGYLKSRHQPRRQEHQRTLVFVHGLKGNRSQFFPLQAFLRVKGYDRVVAYNHSSGPSIEALAMELGDVIAREVKGGQVDIIAHSMGGLISRFYLQNLDGERRVDRLITIGTPHHGTWASRMIPNARLAQMSPDGPFLDDLNEKPMRKTKVFSVGAGSDSLIVPATNALYNDEGKVFEGLGHTSMLLSPSVFRFVEEALAASVVVAA